MSHDEIVQERFMVQFKYGKKPLSAEAKFSGRLLKFPHLQVRVDVGGTEWADFGEYAWSTAESFIHTARATGYVDLT